LGTPGSKIKSLRKQLELEVNVDVFINPKRYLKRLPIEKVVADTKIYRPGVERYKQKIENGEKIAPIIVVKHPTREVYAVLDGHHRYHAYVELGRKEIDCALAGNLSAAGFYATKIGLFQPHPEVTKRLRVPMLQFHDRLEQFLSDFRKDPYRVRELMIEQIRRINSDRKS
jgi:hypothetical protein